MEENKKNKIITINIVQVVKLLIADKKALMCYMLVGALIGIIVAFSIPKIYKTTVILAPEDTSNGFSGSISSLASMVGMNMNLGQNGDAIYPEIYPDVMGSTDFLVGLLPVKVTTKDKSYTADYATYLKKHTKSPWWTLPMAWVGKVVKSFSDGKQPQYNASKKIDPFNLTKEEFELTKAISSKLNCAVDKKTNVISITVEDQDPYVSACIADTVKLRLQAYITDYRTKKARKDVQYLEGIYKEAKSQYQRAQYAYAGYAQGHSNAILESVNQETERLKGEMQLRENIYNTVTQQLQLAKAKVQERTPAFTTIQGASVPNKHSNKPKVFVLAVWMILAFMVRCVVVVWKNKKMIFNI